MREVGSLIIGIFFWACFGYIIINGGTHIRGKEGAKRDEFSKSSTINLAIYFILGMASIVYFIFINYSIK